MNINPVVLDEEAWQQRQREIEKLKKNRDVRSLLKQMGQDEVFLENHSSRFKEYVQTLKTCRSCQGLPFCSQPVTGRCKTLFLDEAGYLNDRYVPCKFSQNRASELAHRRYYTLCHLEENELIPRMDTIFGDQESRNYALVYRNVLENSQTNGKGIYLFGEPGTGKTYLLMALANSRTREKGKTAFVKMSRFMNEMRSNVREEEYTEQILYNLMHTPVVIFDDIGSERITSWSRDSVLFPILDYRMEHHLKTYFTSNFTLQELEECYILSGSPAEKVAAMRLMERIKALTLPLKLTGPSRRQAEGPTFF